MKKKNGTLRLCLDPQNLNKAIKREHYQIPKPEEIISRLNGKKVFSVLDMTKGFWNIPLTEKSSDLCTFSTPMGRYKFLRLPYGISSAPEVLQKVNNQVFGDIPGVEIYFDDIIVSGETTKDHDIALTQVLERAREFKVRFNKNKFQFRVSEVKYVGCRISGQGIKTDEDQVKAIVDLPTPTNKHDVMRLLGMAKHLGQYIPNLSKVTAPLRDLTKQDNLFEWSDIHEKSLSSLKEMLINAPVLGIFDSSKPLTVQTDASKDGLGACICQDGHPLAYASRSLTASERNYAQIEKEMLGIIFGLERFHHYTYGRLVNVQTDHAPLVSVSKKDVAKVSARLQRMKLRLLKYQIDVHYVPGKELFLADTLSRAFVTSSSDGSDEKEFKYVVHSISKHLPMTSDRREQFIKATSEDDTLVCLSSLFQNGWPSERFRVPEVARFYWHMRDTIYVADQLVFSGEKLIVPLQLRSDMLKLIHEGHSGMERCKARAREILYWPGMGDEIEAYVAKCKICEKFGRKQTKEPLIPHPVPNRAWENIASDILEFGGKDYLVVVDYYSKWIELCQIPDKTASTVIMRLKSMFARFGIPDKLISDNMPYASREFKQFCNEWNFESTTSSPLYPQSNGMSERAVGIVKNILRKTAEEGKDPLIGLLEYRSTPIKGIGLSPAQLLFNHRIKTKLPVADTLLQPEMCKDVKNKLLDKQLLQKQYYDSSSKPLKPLVKDENIVILKGNVWEPGVVKDCCVTPRSYIVQDQRGKIYRRNRRFLKRSSNPINIVTDDSSLTNLEPSLVEPTKDLEHTAVSRSLDPVPADENDIFVTRSGRAIHKPSRYLD